MRNIKEAWHRSHRGTRFLRIATKEIAAVKEWVATVNAVAESAVPFLGNACIVSVSPPGGEPIIAARSAIPLKRIHEIAAGLPGAKYRAQKIVWGDSPATDDFLYLSQCNLGWLMPLRTGDGDWGQIFCASMASTSTSATVFQDYADLSAILIQAAWRWEDSRQTISVQDEFLITASHELKTPVTTLRLQAYSLRKVLTHAGLKDSVEKTSSYLLDLVERQMIRLETLIDSFLEATRFRSGRLELLRCETDLAGSIKKIVDRHQLELEHAGCTVTLNIESILVGDWDQQRLEQALSNILVNAIKYGRGKPIDIRVYKDGDSAILSIKDRGIGIAEEDQFRIFERFERAVSALDFSGIGVGLYIAKRIIEAHQGSIQIQSRVGEGAEFIVHLPLATAQGASSLSA